jgi:hypothetical protein
MPLLLFKLLLRLPLLPLLLDHSMNQLLQILSGLLTNVLHY